MSHPFIKHILLSDLYSILNDNSSLRYLYVTSTILDWQVEDVNDNAPQLNAVSYEGSIRENSPSGTLVRISPSIQV